MKIQMNNIVNKLMVVGLVTVGMSGALAQSAFAGHDKVTTITRSYARPVVIETPVLVTTPSTTTTTVQRSYVAPAQPIVIEQTSPVIMERQTILSSPVVQERRVEILNSAPSSSSTTVTRTTIQAQ